MPKCPNQFCSNMFSAPAYNPITKVIALSVQFWTRGAIAVALVATGLIAPRFAAAADELQIVPATKVVTHAEVAAPAPEGNQKPATAASAQSYAQVFRSIPFSRAEYNANPSYRHDAAMELLFGQLRPTTIVRNAPEPIVSRYDYITPYSYFRNYGNGFGYGRTYNFYYPRPSVYRRY